MPVSRRLIASMLSAPLIMAACGGTSSSSSAAHSPMPSGEEAMMMQPGAENMKVDVLSPADGTKVTGNTVGVQVRTTGRKPHRLDPSGLENPFHLLGEQRIAVVEEVALAVEDTVDVVGEVASDLLHPFAMRFANQTSDVHATVLDVDDE